MLSNSANTIYKKLCSFFSFLKWFGRNKIILIVMDSPEFEKYLCLGSNNWQKNWLFKIGKKGDVYKVK